MSEPGKVYCFRCKYKGERTDEKNHRCNHPAFQSTDFLGLQEKPLCSHVNASKNCNGFELKQEAQ